MLFLDAGILDSIGLAIQGAMRSIFYLICSLLYQLVVWLYNTFYILCTSRLLSIDVINTVAKRVGLILGLIMLFMVIISFIKNLIEPDTLSDKTKGPVNIIKRVLVVIVLFGVSSFAFNGLYYLQNLVLESNIFNKLLIPAQVSNDNFGAQIATSLFMSFYTIDSDVAEAYPTGANSDVTACELKREVLMERIYFVQRFDVGNDCLNKSVTVKYDNGEDEQRFIIDFSWLLCTATAVFLIWFLFSYCLNVGVRMIQLAFLEIISPIAFVGYLQPKDDNMFTKWLKIYVSTYIDVFLRIAIISFAVFLIGIILGNGSDGYSVFWNSIGNPDDWQTRRFIEIIMIFALLTFAKKAPDLLKEIFPTGAAKLGLGAVTPKQMFSNMLGGDLVKTGMTGAAGLGIGLAVGGVGNAIRAGVKAKNEGNSVLKAALGGAAGGLLSGGIGGAKAKGVLKSFGASNKAAMAQNQRIADWRDEGGTSTLARWGTAWQQRLGLTTESQRLERDKTRLDNEKAAYSEYNGYIDEAEKRAEAQIRKGAFAHNAHANAALAAEKLAEIYTQQSSNIKKSDFENDSAYLNYLQANGINFKAPDRAEVIKNINKADYASNEAYDIACEKAYSDAIRSSTAKMKIKDENGNDKEIEITFDNFVEKSYNNALNELAEKASKESSKALTEMKAAKADFITEVLQGNGSLDGVTFQKLENAAGVLDAYEGRNYDGFNFVDNETGQKITMTRSVLMSGYTNSNGTTVNASYKIVDDSNSNSKARQTVIINELAENAQHGRAARANEKYSGVEKK